MARLNLIVSKLSPACAKYIPLIRVCSSGVAAASGGNHGAAVAYSAKKLGHNAKIFVPEISTSQKVEKIKSAGAELLVEGAKYADALVLCEAFQDETGAMPIHAYDSEQTIAGQGTVALEWLEQVESLDTLLVAVGGGGLVAGIVAATTGRCNVVAVEPEGSCCLQTALKNDAPTPVEVTSVAADSLGATTLGGLSFEICREGLHQSLAIPDNAIKQAQHALWNKYQIVSEPGGATALAALICGAYKPKSGERVGGIPRGGPEEAQSQPRYVWPRAGQGGSTLRRWIDQVVQVVDCENSGATEQCRQPGRRSSDGVLGEQYQ